MATTTFANPVHGSRHVAGAADALPWGTIHGANTLANRPTAAAGNTGYLFFQTDSAGTGAGIYRSDGTAWTQMANLGAGISDATTGAKGIVQLAGDLAGAAASPLVAKVNGTSVPATPTAGQVLKATSGTAATWASAVSVADNGDGTSTMTY